MNMQLVRDQIYYNALRALEDLITLPTAVHNAPQKMIFYFLITPHLNINYTQRPLKGRKWKTTVFHFLKYSKTSCTLLYNYCNSTVIVVINHKRGWNVI